MKFLIFVSSILIMAWVVVYVTRHAWSEPLQDYIAGVASDAIHSPDSGPSFIKGFAGGVAKKLIKLELGKL